MQYMELSSVARQAYYLKSITYTAVGITLLCLVIVGLERV